MMNKKISALIAITICFCMSEARANEKLPEHAMPLSEVVRSLEAKGYSRITGISIDDGVWEVETQKDGQERELKVDPASAEIISDRPDD